MKKSLIIGIAVLFVVLVSGTAAAFAMEKEVEVRFSDRTDELQISGFYDTLSDALASEGQNVEQMKKQYTPSVPWDQKLGKDTKVTLTCNCEVTLKENGKEKGKFKTTAQTVEAFLQTQKVSVSKWDQVSPALNQKITNGMTISVEKVETKISKVVKTIPYQVKEEKDPELEEGKKVEKVKGKEGKEVYQVTTLYKNGKPVMKDGKPQIEKKLVSKVEPVDKVIKIGTKKEKEKDEDKDKDKNTQDEQGCKLMSGFEATAYEPSVGSKTATGHPVRRGVIAVDPSVIPLYSKVYVPGYGWGQALDTGGAIKGKIVDVFVESAAEARSWGRKHDLTHLSA
ncbi:3D domain-containing protein [Thermoflavimicrobium dichotomicum]|uniref:3D (Asp-Asp-Asp) domain-containing protein n=1 Tax=Thermoflavimicrobium dichotomicum TaxID=46223 RepID=A0A1I3NC36_9BACL|nr:3D domain-containing protein [Thermoflavimicrobium dichotomicum]SFJ06814.1 3D (Asp-Asp-Asp) domain-containing protein [Thermoflavimicrobium dichotomicum]